MDGAKMSSLAALKLRQMDSEKKKMKAAKEKAAAQVVEDVREIGQLDSALEKLRGKRDPLAKRLEGKLAERENLRTSAKQAAEFMTESMKSQKEDLHKVLFERQRMGKKQASEKLKEERGFGMEGAGCSAKATRRTGEEGWKKAQDEAHVPLSVLKSASQKVVITSTNFQATLVPAVSVNVKLGAGVMASTPSAV